AAATSTTTVSAAKIAPVMVGKWLAVAAVVGAGAVAAVHVARPWTSSLQATQLAAKAAQVAPAQQAAPAIEAIAPAPTVADLPEAPVSVPVAVPSRAVKASPSASADITCE